MAKKRTLIPGYGKVEQGLEADGARALRAGDRENATALFRLAKTRTYNKGAEIRARESKTRARVIGARTYG